MSRERVAAIVGPTAVGKTEVALEVAEALGAEIISVDSMQIYRGMDVGTAKPTPAMRRRVPHHLVDLHDPLDDVTVAEFQALAREAIHDVSERGRLPLLVGGSGLYFRAVVDDLRFPPRSEELRETLEIEAERVGGAGLHARLRAVDPAAASRIEPGNVRRTIRALEVIDLTGRLFSDNDAWERYESRFELRVAGLERSRAELYRRIESRVDQMLAGGLPEEVDRLKAHGLGRTAGQALGYRHLLGALPGADRAEARGDIIRATKRFARRQESWFRADPRVRWFDAGHLDVTGAIARFIAHAG